MGMNKRKATKAHTKCTYWESTHNKINKQTWTCKLSSTQENAHTQPSLCVHGFFGYSPAPHNKLHEIFSEFFNMCSFPFRTCRSAKKNVGGGSDGEMGRRGGEGVNEGKAERALGESGRASQKMTGRSREREERERERKPSWLCSKLLPLATALAQPASHWPVDSMHHNPMHGSSANQGFPCNSAFWISFSPWQHKPALGHGCGLCSVHTRTHAHSPYCTHCTVMTIPWWVPTKAICLKATEI